jgi:hypothetical protein
MDVNFLNQQAVDQSYLFVVDSASRDTTFSTTASEYMVAFNWPFENVVGIDLIDASIPRTEYIVDTGVNTLQLTYDSTKYTITVPPGDYALPQLIEVLAPLLPSGLGVAAATQPAEIANKVEFSGQAPFFIDVKTSTMRRQLGLGSPTDTPDHDGILGAAQATLPSAVAVLTGPLPTLSQPVPLTHSVRQVWTASRSGVPVTLNAFANAPTISTSISVLVADLLTNTPVATGTLLTGTSSFEQLTCTLSPVGDGKVTQGAQYYVMLAANASGAGVFASGPAVDTLIGGAWTGGTDALCVDLDVLPLGFSLQAPCLVDLTGERYLLVRCPEVESLLFRDRAYEKMHAGLGIVKLAGYGQRNERFDFVSVPSRRLRTPIGKLLSFTIRLEKSDGTLYNTRGVEHHLIMAIHYREMVSQPSMPKALLNPGYNPDPTVPWGVQQAPRRF